MTYVPKRNHPKHERVPEWDDSPRSVSITVYALSANRRPIGFAPWPEEPKGKKGKKGKKR